MTDPCPSCDKTAALNFGEEHKVTLKWAYSVHCPYCSYKEHHQVVGRLPVEFRNVLLAQEGRYQLVVLAAKAGINHVLKVVREVFVPSFDEITAFGDKIPGWILTGTKQEMGYVEMRLCAEFPDMVIKVERV